MRLASLSIPCAVLPIAVCFAGCGGTTEIGGTTEAGPSNPYIPSVSSVTALAAAGFTENTCALNGDGSVSCWGLNRAGQDGIPPDVNCYNTPNTVEGLSQGAIAIAAGDGFNCVASESGAVLCWGINDYGQLGVSPIPMTGTPTPIAGITNAIHVSAAGGAACAGSADGTWQCWGVTFSGAASPQPYTVPVANALQMSLGDGGLVCALLGDGSVTCENGGPPFSRVPGLAYASDVSVGQFQACAVTSDGRVSCWGQNEYGELGVFGSSPAGLVVVPDVEAAIEVSASDRYTCAVLGTGQVVCWGSNHYGTLGTTDLPDSQPCNPDPPEGDVDVCSAPVVVPGIQGAIHIATAGDHVCALLADGTVECWGTGSQCP
jgi:alpha-tubulin suppressor-like RCC1 family protein